MLKGIRERGSIWNYSLVPCFLRICSLCLLMAWKNAKVITETNAKQHNTICGKIPQKDESESRVFAGVLIAIVELYNSAVTDKLELVTILVQKSPISREELWLDDRPLIYVSGIVLKMHKTHLFINIKIEHLQLGRLSLLINH